MHCSGLTQVAPITWCVDPSLNTASAAILARHCTAWPQVPPHHAPSPYPFYFRQERIVQQRQIVRAVPVARVDCMHGGGELVFHVVGVDRQVGSMTLPHVAHLV